MESGALSWRRFCGALLLGAIVAPAAAHAYCRTTTQEVGGTCPSTCASGTALAWGTPQIEYAYNDRAFTGSSGEAYRAAIARSFAHWEDVSCEGRRVGFAFELLPEPTSLTVGPLEQEPNLNVVSALTAAEWDELEFDPHAFAKTKLWFDLTSGEIVGADIAFNTALGAIAVCPESGCAPGAVDLENVATHEIGHLLGLSHSADPSATMWCDAVRGDLEKRSLADDDIAGLCAIYGAPNAFMDPGPQPTTPDKSTANNSSAGGGCALGATGERPPASVLFALVALFARRRRARAR